MTSVSWRALGDTTSKADRPVATLRSGQAIHRIHERSPAATVILAIEDNFDGGASERALVDVLRAQHDMKRDKALECLSFLMDDGLLLRSDEGEKYRLTDGASPVLDHLRRKRLGASGLYQD